MRTLIKHFLIDTVSLYLVSMVVTGMVFADGVNTLLLAGFVLMLANMVIKPIINILLLPLNLITLNLFKWVTYAITFYIVTLIVPGFILTKFVFAGFNSYWFNLPPVSLSGVFAFVAFSFVITFVSSVFHWVFK